MDRHRERLSIMPHTRSTCESACRWSGMRSRLVVPLGLGRLLSGIEPQLGRGREPRHLHVPEPRHRPGPAPQAASGDHWIGCDDEHEGEYVLAQGGGRRRCRRDLAAVHGRRGPYRFRSFFTVQPEKAGDVEAGIASAVSLTIEGIAPRFGASAPRAAAVSRPRAVDG